MGIFVGILIKRVTCVEFLKKIRLIQGGMGIHVSHWRLAKAAAKSRPGVIAGTVSGTAADFAMVRQLQLGDPGGHIREALQNLDIKYTTKVGRKILDKYFLPHSKAPQDRYKNPPRCTISNSVDGGRMIPNYQQIELKIEDELIELWIATGFTQVYLAKKGHAGPIFINFLYKIELPLLYTMYGAMLAGVDGIVVGAGNPDGLPKICSQLTRHEKVSIEPTVLYKEVDQKLFITCDPQKICEGVFARKPLVRPAFLSIVSSEHLAVALANSSSEPPDGLIIENHTAGGHNANPSGPMIKDQQGQPIYGDKDIADLEVIRKTGLPFWLGGGLASREKLEFALESGAQGIQAGTIYAMCEESGMRSDHRCAIFKRLRNNSDDSIIVRTTLFSPTGFCFKVADVENTLFDNSIYLMRKRACDIGLLRQIGLDKPNEAGQRRLFQRCPAEPLESFVKNRGLLRNSAEKRCLCNGLIAGAGFPQTTRNNQNQEWEEPSIVTIGENLDGVRRLSSNGQHPYWCIDIAKDILGERS